MSVLLVPISFAQEPQNLTDASFASRCASVPDGYPECADSPTECESDSACGFTPFNCLFLQEPIGGRPGYDLFKVNCAPNPASGGTDSCPGQDTICTYTLYYGEAIVGNEAGPYQAILSFEKDKDTQGPFGLLYNYLGLLYNYLSGIIIAFVILVVILGGVRIITSAGDAQKYQDGKGWIIKALIGMALWFTASVILYTINPTFFAF